MAIHRAQIAFEVDTAVPRDNCVITPHYQGADPQQLADALKTNLTNLAGVGIGPKFTVKVYNAQGPLPHPPLGTASAGTTPKGSIGPREVSLCLSYFAGFNVKRFRGRVYIPNAFLGGTTGLRPTASQMTAALNFRNALGKNLSANAVWCVFSRVLNQSLPITDVWVDDEWDTVRSRGSRTTARQTATIP